MLEELPQPIRCFIAIHVPRGLIDKIVSVQKEAQGRGNMEVVRWTRPEQMHITLKFLGNVPHAQLAALQHALAKAVLGNAPFALSLEGFGCFPSARNPNVFWAGLGGHVEALNQLQACVEVATKPFTSHEEDRVFHPHLTIGRVKTRGPGSRRIAEALVQLRLANVDQWTVREVALMGSNLSPQGAIHTLLAAAQLIGEPAV
jgi:RNA 2',3'-cyclic 3'-phosphodiesterase